MVGPHYTATAVLKPDLIGFALSSEHGRESRKKSAASAFLLDRG
jgi:hypothetical protein